MIKTCALLEFQLESIHSRRDVYESDVQRSLQENFTLFVLVRVQLCSHL